MEDRPLFLKPKKHETSYLGQRLDINKIPRLFEHSIPKTNILILYVTFTELHSDQAFLTKFSVAAHRLNGNDRMAKSLAKHLLRLSLGGWIKGLI